MNESISWIGVDWGTTHLRAYGLNNRQEVVCQSQSTQGMGTLGVNGFEPALLSLIHDWLDPHRNTLVLACGMVGARQGWRESPYAVVPCSPGAPIALTPVSSEDPRIDVRIIAGLSQYTPADVMRGEETQLLGLMSSVDDFPPVVCLPGTHSKWARLEGQQVQRFQTYITGELFSLLNQHSVLRHNTGGSGWEEGAFLDAIEEAVARPQDLLNGCFSIRASSLLENTSSAYSKARLSGWIIGGELASARSYWQGQTVALIGAEALVSRYARALQKLGVSTKLFDPDAMTLAGLQQVFLQHENQHSGGRNV